MEEPCIHGFRILQQIGEGSSGKIFHSTRISDNLPCCVKIIHKEGSNQTNNSEECMNFEAEFNAMKNVSHQHIVKYIDFFQDNNNYYLFMEYCKGNDLLNLININHGLKEPIAKKIFIQIAETMYFLHQINICHRDIKPEHIIVREDYNIKIIDFGLSAIKVTSSLSTFCGSLQYSAPETLMNQPYDGIKADTWSAGVVLYAMLTGKLPFDNENSQVTMRLIIFGKYSLSESISPLEANLIHSMLELDPAQRYTFREVLNHPWITGDTSKILEPQIKLQKKVKYRNIPAPSKLPKKSLNTESCIEIRHLQRPNRLTSSTKCFSGVKFKLRKRSTSDSTADFSYVTSPKSILTDGKEVTC